MTYRAAVIVAALAVGAMMSCQQTGQIRGKPVAVPSLDRRSDLIRHDLVVVLQPDRGRVMVEDTITLPPDLCRSGVGFTLNAALTISSATPAVREVVETEGEVHYVVQEAPADGRLVLNYAGDLAFGLSDQKEEYTRGFRETRGIVGPDGVYLAGSSAWVAGFDDRMIEFSLDVRGPRDWHVISQGNGSSRVETGRAMWQSAGAVEQVYLVGGPLIMHLDDTGPVEALVYLHEQNEQLARQYLDATSQYVSMYNALIGPYPYEKFALVENFWETGYGMPSFTLLGPQIIRMPFIVHSSYPHEILHNWWGNSVFVDAARGNWCEGLTAYMADHLIQEQQGRAHDYRRDTLRKYRDHVQEGRDFPLSQFRARHSAATEAVGYGKALMLFHMLRRHVGDHVFRSALARFYRQQRGDRASFDDLRTTFELETGENMASFFTQWLDRPGAPMLALENVNAAPTGDGWTLRGTLEQTQQGAPFELEVLLQVLSADGAHTTLISTADRRHDFEIQLASEPQTVVVDPMFDVFRLLDPRETPPALGQLFGEPSILAVLPATNDESQIQYRQFITGWQWDEHAIEVVHDDELAAIPADRSVWLFGRDNRFASLMRIDRSEDMVTLGEADVSLGDHSVVAVRPHPENFRKAIGWISVDSPQAIPGLIRKLPHYGKYSYLAFEGAAPSNVVKGQWPPDSSPLVVQLTDNRRPPQIEAREPLAAPENAGR